MNKDLSSKLKKVWHFISKDDSFASLFVNFILALILIKFIVYPLLGIIFQTGFPIVAVVSGSMEHGYAPRTDMFGTIPTDADGDNLFYYCDKQEYMKSVFPFNRHFTNFNEFWNICGDWYESNNISKDQFKTFPFTNGFNKGDIMILYGAKLEDIKVGDIVVFQGKLRSDPIIHRVVGKTTENGKVSLQTKGDHNDRIISQIGEHDITNDIYYAKAILKVPYVGWAKIWFTNSIIFMNNVVRGSRTPYL